MEWEECQVKRVHHLWLFDKGAVSIAAVRLWQEANMNRIYRLAWSHARGCVVPVAETMPSQGKISRGKFSKSIYGDKRGVAALVAAISLLLDTVAAHAAPTDGDITSGAGHISRVRSITTITQSSQSLSLNWTSFNIAPEETVNFLQPSTSVSIGAQQQRRLLIAMPCTGIICAEPR